MKKFSIFAICFAFLLVCCEADFNIQSTTYYSVPDSILGEITMKPFIRIGEKYYLVEGTQKLNWYAAQHFCRRLGANLASIESAAEMQAISGYLKSIDHKGWFWLSGNDLSAESQFSWMGTGKAMVYTNWSPGQPDNAGGNENCVHLWPHADAFAMNDWQCNQNTHYICEAHSPKLITFAVW